MLNLTNDELINNMANKIIQTALCISVFSGLQACSTTQTPLRYLDFGAPLKSAPPIGCELLPLTIADVTTTQALDSNLVLYRLLYSNELQTRAYANYRWSMTPVQLLTLQVKTQLADNSVRLVDDGLANPDGLQIRLELTDFSQYFADATHSYAQLKLRATTIRDNTVRAQSTFTRQANADTPDAIGGAQAMRLATDAVISDLSSWLCKLPRP